MSSEPLCNLDEAIKLVKPLCDDDGLSEKQQHAMHLVWRYANAQEQRWKKCQRNYKKLLGKYRALKEEVGLEPNVEFDDDPFGECSDS